MIDTKPTTKTWRYKAPKAEPLKQYLAEVNLTTTVESPKNLTNILKECCETVLQSKKPRNNRTGKPWWSEKLKDLRSKFLASKRILTRANLKTKGQPRQEILNSYKDNYHEFLLEKKAAKGRLHEKLCNEIDNNPWGDAYRVAISRLKPRLRSAAPRNPGAVLNSLFPTHAKLDYEAIPTMTPNEFSVSEIVAAARKLKNNKSPGPDGVPNEVIKLAACSTTNLLSQALNSALKDGTFPDIWKIATLKLIPKEGNTELTPKYRPLCMINGTAKLLEHLINTRLKQDLTTKGALSDKQHAFREKRSTLTAIDAVLNFADKTKKRGPGWVTTIILLDVKNAFNSASWEKILKIMREKKVEAYLINMIASYFKDRTLSLGDISFRLTSGVPQGSVLGPTLWNILIDPVAQIALPDYCDIVLYADDIALLIGANDSKTMTHRGNLALSRTQTALNELGLDLATQKTQALILTGKRTAVAEDISFTLNDTRIKPKREVKYLGLVLDPDLNFKAHAEKTCLKATKTFHALSAILGAKNAKTARRRIIARVVEGQLLYGCEIWMGKMANTALHELEAVQKRAAVKIVRGFKSMSGEGALVLAGMVPLGMQAEARKTNFQREKRMKKDELLKRWQERWSKTNPTWTRSLIPQIELWINRKHGELTSHMTEVLSGHGNFGSFLKVTNRKENGQCPYCNTQETVRHQMLYCPRFDKERHAAGLQAECDPRTIVKIMLKSQEHWTHIDALAFVICKSGTPSS